MNKNPHGCAGAIENGALIGKAVKRDVRSHSHCNDDREAEEFVRQIVKKLRPDAFVETVSLPYPLESGLIQADVYGINFEEVAWYVKFYIDTNERLRITSCHKPEYQLKTVDGRTIK